MTTVDITIRNNIRIIPYSKSQQEAWLANTRISNQQKFEQIVTVKEKPHMNYLFMHNGCEYI